VKLSIILTVVTALLFGTVATASAGTASGTTALLGTPVSGASVDVDVSVVSGAPVVPYVYSLQNECYFSGKTSGPPDAYQRDDIVNWNFSSPPNIPHAIMPVNLLPVPKDSVCKVSIVKDNTVVKGSVTKYTVQ